MVKKSRKKGKRRSNLPLIFLAVVAGLGAYVLIAGGNEKLPDVALPSYAQKSERVAMAYKVAVAYPEIGRAVPCYCGCKYVRNAQYPTGHKNLRNCFVDDLGRFTPHGANCFICIDEMLESYEMYKQGRSLHEIRAAIDAKYAGRYADPTPTPPV